MAKRKSVKKVQEPGFCPACGKNTLEFGDNDFIFGDMYYKFNCTSCGKTGREWYHLNYFESNIDE